MIFGTEEILRIANESIQMLYLMYKREEGEKDDNFNKIKNGIKIKIPINLIEYEKARGRFAFKPKNDTIYDYVTGEEYNAEEIEEEKEQRTDLMLKWLLQEEESTTKTYDV